MPAVLDAVETGLDANETPIDRRIAHLVAYQFKRGHAPLNGGGRPKGSKSFSTILTAAAPRMAKRYVKEALSGNAAILTDARKVFVPTDAETPQTAGQIVVVLMGDTPHLDAAPSLPYDESSIRIAESSHQPASLTPTLISPPATRRVEA
jgi:hypothetical protein